jgi:hypothetical protein
LTANYLAAVGAHPWAGQISSNPAVCGELLEVEPRVMETSAEDYVEMGCKPGIPGIPSKRLFESEINGVAGPLGASSIWQLCEESNDILIDGLQKDCSGVFTFIALCGLVWFKKHKRILLYNIVVISAYLPLAVYADTGATQEDLTNPNNHLFGAFFYPIVIFTQCGSIIVCVWSNGRRLNSKCSKLELSVHSQTLNTSLCSGFFAAAISLSFVPFASDRDGMLVMGSLMFFQVIVSVALIANAHFLYVDTRIATYMLNSLTSRWLKYNALSVDDVDTVRRAIDQRLKAGFVATSALIGVALFNVIFALGLFIFIEDSKTLYMSAAYLSKEVLIAAFGLYCAACTNEQYHTLVQCLGQAVGELKLDLTQPLDNQKDKLQLPLILQGLISRPIQFPLVGLSFTRKEVLVRCLLYLFSMLLSGVKNEL